MNKKKTSKKKMRQKRMIKIVAGIVILGILLAGCIWLIKSKDGSKVGSAQTAAADEQEQGQMQEQEQEPIQEPEHMVIHTKYGELYYPEQWKEYLNMETEEAEDSVKIVFQANINDTMYPLFEVTIGAENGALVGQVVDADGEKHDVYMHAEEVEEIDNLSQEEQDRLFAMKEGLNYIIEYLE